MGRRVVGADRDSRAAVARRSDAVPLRDPQGSGAGDYLARTARLEARYAPDVIRHFAVAEYGGIELVDSSVL